MAKAMQVKGPELRKQLSRQMSMKRNRDFNASLEQSDVSSTSSVQAREEEVEEARFIEAGHQRFELFGDLNPASQVPIDEDSEAESSSHPQSLSKSFRGRSF